MTTPTRRNGSTRADSLARAWTLALATAAVATHAPACRRDSGTPAARPSRTTQAAAATPTAPANGGPPPAQTPFVPLPAVEALDANKVTLGRRLFHDPGLSRDGTVSCASCHGLDRGGVDGRATSVGINNQRGPINSPTVLNARFNFVQFWDGRARDLTEQAGGPITNPLEMGNEWTNLVAALGRDATYPAQFRAAYPDGITPANIRDAIATYEMTLVTPSRFDRWLRGDVAAITAQERAGHDLFVSVGCPTCHTGVNVGGTTFQKMGAVRNYFAERGTPLTEADNGRFNVTHQETDRHFFKVPTLRNVERTAPYFHDGSQETLEGTVRTMASVQLGRTLTEDEASRIAAFLRTMTGELPAAARMPAAAAGAPGAAAGGS